MKLTFNLFTGSSYQRDGTRADARPPATPAHTPASHSRPSAPLLSRRASTVSQFGAGVQDWKYFDDGHKLRLLVETDTRKVRQFLNQHPQVSRSTARE